MKRKKSSRSGREQTNRSIMRVTYAVAALFAAMIIYFCWFVQAEAPRVIGNTYNPRVDLMADRVVRGEIRTADGAVLAETVAEADGTERRSYPYGALFAPVTGYMQKGKTGVESLANFYLLSSHVNTLEKVQKELLGQKNTGDAVWLTVDQALTETASEALGDRRGAVIAMDPESGKILTMVSKPSFDPNTIADDWERLTAEDNDSAQLLNRAAQGAYPPGSTFKILTLLAYVHAHPSDYEAFTFDCTGSYTDSEGNIIRCYGGEVHGQQTLSEAFANSCNGAFAKIGEELPVKDLTELAEKLLFNQALPFDLPSTAGRFRLTEADSAFMRGQTAIGQGETTTSPLQVLLITSAIANGGELMKPMLLDHLENAGGQSFKTFQPQSYGRLFSEADAAYLSEQMRKVVSDGTGSAFRDAAYEARAKTGSAEYESGGGKKTHAWCTAFAEWNGRQIAVCVLVEDGQSGGRTAAPVARAVMDAWLLR